MLLDEIAASTIGNQNICPVFSANVSLIPQSYSSIMFYLIPLPWMFPALVFFIARTLVCNKNKPSFVIISQYKTFSDDLAFRGKNKSEPLILSIKSSLDWKYINYYIFLFYIISVFVATLRFSLFCYPI